MLTALNAWYRSDKLIGQRGGVYVSLENNNDEKRFMKKNVPMSILKFAIETFKINNYSYSNHNLFF